MRKDTPNNRPIALDAGNAIDWEHPDNRGLVYLMGGYAGTHAAGGVVPNLVTKNPCSLSMTGAGQWVNAGPGIGGVRGNTTTSGAELLAPSALRIGFPITIACSVRSIGSPSNQANIFGIQHNNTNSAPFASNAIGIDGSGNINYFGNSAGSFFNIATASTLSSRTSPTRLVVVVTSSRVDIYINGVLDTSSVSARSAPTYGTTALMSVCNYTGIARNTNAIVWGGRIQNFAADARWVERDYRASLTPTADDRLRWFSTRSYSLPGGTSDAVGTASGTSTASGVGAALVAGVASASGSCTVAATGAASADGVASASGTSTASAVGNSAGTGSAVGTASGTSTASAVGAAAIAAIFSAVGTCTVNGIAPSGIVSDGRTVSGVDMGSRSVSGRGPN